MVHICEIPHSIRRVDYVFYHMSDVVVIVHELYYNLDKWLVHFLGIIQYIFITR